MSVSGQQNSATEDVVVEHPCGSLQDERRLNVGITRARRLLVVLGSATTLELSGCLPWLSFLEHVRSTGSVINSAQLVTGEDGMRTGTPVPTAVHRRGGATPPFMGEPTPHVALLPTAAAAAIYRTSVREMHSTRAWRDERGMSLSGRILCGQPTPRAKTGSHQLTSSSARAPGRPFCKGHAPPVASLHRALSMLCTPASRSRLPRSLFWTQGAHLWICWSS